MIKRSVRPKYKDLYLQALQELRESEKIAEYWYERYSEATNQPKDTKDGEIPSISHYYTSQALENLKK